MPDLSVLKVSSDGNFLDALRAIQAGGAGICLVVEAGARFVGILTDGDVRRALIDGRSLSDPIQGSVSNSPAVVGVAEDRAYVLDVMQALHLDAIPVIENGDVVGLHTLQAILGISDRRNWAVIMAGGLGSRLGDLTADTPKPMLTVAGRPILERIILHLLSSGFRKIALSVNYKADVIERYFGDGSKFGCELIYIKEKPDQPLGTAGSLRLFSEMGLSRADPIVVLNGDVLTRASIASILDFHELRSNDMTVGAIDHGYQVPFGVIVADEDDSLVEINEKPMNSWRVCAGINVIEPEIIDLIPDTGSFDMTDLYSAAIKDGRSIEAFDLDSSWIDVGRPKDLTVARGGLTQ